MQIIFKYTSVVCLVICMAGCRYKHLEGSIESIDSTRVVIPDTTIRTEKGNCIDSTRIDKQAMCTMDYSPVCGCDGKTYSNACVASVKGVTKWREGECTFKK